MGRILFTGARLVDPEAPHAGEPPLGGLLVEDGRIAARFGAGAPDGGGERPAPPSHPDAEIRDLAGAWLAPGFVDLHFHGELAFVGADDADGALVRAAASCARHGATAFLATTVALPERALAPLVRALAAAVASNARTDPGGGASPGARPIGIHLEGPWIDAGMAGAQPPGGIRPPAPEEVRALLDAGDGAIRLVTLAPELEGSGTLLRALAERGVVPAVGHSRASPDALERAIGLGLSHATHLFNAMSPLHHRDLGVAGLALTDDRLSCDLIADGVHVHPAIARLAAHAKAERLLLVTDRVEPPAYGRTLTGAMPAGLRSDGVALRLPDGRLAGSCLGLDAAVRNMTRWRAMTRVEAIAACTVRPARLLGLEASLGTLRPGSRADLVILGAEDGAVRETWVGGRRVYAAPAG